MVKSININDWHSEGKFEWPISIRLSFTLRTKKLGNLISSSNCILISSIGLSKLSQLFSLEVPGSLS